MTKALEQQPASKNKAVAAQGSLRCVCGDYLVGAHDQLLQCQQCTNWVHAECVGIGLQPSFIAKVRRTFVCPFCLGTFRKRTRNEGQQMVKLVEIADVKPANLALFDGAVSQIRKSLMASNFVVVEFPRVALTDAMVDESMDCCKSSIANLTFSESYPRYCLNEQQQNHHAYLQGAAARCVATQKLVSVVLGNGMDPYTNLRGSITHLKALLTRGTVNPTGITSDALQIVAVDDFVHFTLIVTDDGYRGQGLAKRLLLFEMARWCARGRTRAFLNMALEKTVVGDKTKCSVSEAAKKLYSQCGFTELCERTDSDGNEVWTKREEDMGRIMVNLDMPATLKTAIQLLSGGTSPKRALKLSVR
jgi:GNAT superfamily N-acetyltransferase